MPQKSKIKELVRRPASPARQNTPDASTPGPRPSAANTPHSAGNLQIQSALRQSVLGANLEISKPGDAIEQDAQQLTSGSSAARIAARPAISAPKGLPREAGTPLSVATRQIVEPSMGADFSNVRVHDSLNARAAAAQLGARAFTHGSDIWLGPGERQDDRDLMTHELAHVVQHARSPAPRLMRQTVAGALPSQVALDRVSLAFDLPGDKELSSNWKANLTTTNPTTVTLAITPAGLQVSFSPVLRIDAQWPYSDMDWSGVTYDFATGTISSIGLVETDIGFSGSSDARAAISSFFLSLISGTRMANAGYDPLTDTDVMGTLNGIKTNFTSLPSSGGEVTAADVTRITASADVTFRSPVTQGTPQGSLVIGGNAHISVHLHGTAAGLGALPPEVDEIVITGSSIVVQKDGADVVQIHQVTIHYGGAVEIGRMTLLGAAREAAQTERGLRGLFYILLLAAGGPEDRLRVENAELPIDAEIVPGIARRTIQDAMTEAVRRLILENANIIPGYDLTTVFGIARPPSPPGDYPQHLPGETPTTRYG